jgi:hypothetical protein
VTLKNDLTVPDTRVETGLITVGFLDEFQAFTDYGTHYVNFETWVGPVNYEMTTDSSSMDDSVLHSDSAYGTDVKGWAFRAFDETAIYIDSVEYDVSARDHVVGTACGSGGLFRLFDFAITDGPATWPDWDTEPTAALSVDVVDGAGFTSLSGSASLTAPVSELTLALMHVDSSNICTVDVYWDDVSLTPRPLTVDVAIDWHNECAAQAPQIVKAEDLPAGTYRVMALESAADNYSGTTNWHYNITCENLSAPSLSTGGEHYATAEEAFDNLEAYTEIVSYAGGDLICGVSDDPCTDNEGEIEFRMEFLHP